MQKNRGRFASALCALVIIAVGSWAAPADAAPIVAGDPYHNGCALDSSGFNTTTISDHGHLHMTDPANGNEIGDAYLFYTPHCQGYFLTILSRGNHYYVHPSLWPASLSSPVVGLSSLYVGNGLAWTYLLGGMTGLAVCGKIDVTTPYGQPITTVDLGCGGPA